MGKINVKTTSPVLPTIYAYSTPEIARHDGWIKIGYTESQTVEERVAQQTKTAGVKAVILWESNAIYSSGYKTFHDTDFHKYLEKKGIEREPDTEWFRIDPDRAETLLDEFKRTRGVVAKDDVASYELRAEQERAVELTLDYATLGDHREFLWNAKPRFGKTLSVYDFVKRLGARNVLIVTNRPAVANSWYSDYEKFVGTKEGYYFVSESDAVKGGRLVLSRQAFETVKKPDKKRIEFVSLQDLKGSIYFGGEFDKLKHLLEIHWDVLVVDEAHEGVDTDKTIVAFDRIERDFTLHLSGTPFKAIANDKFPQSAIYDWTYADEQRAKREWSAESSNPYADLPRLNLFTYQMSEIVEEELAKGFELDGETVDYAFDLNEFFATKNGRFIHEDSVDRFLDALTTQEKFPFSTPELRAELRHTFWLLNRVESAKCLATKLKKHPVFKEYEIVLAAGDGKLDENDDGDKAFNRVRRAIEKFDRTITLSVTQLTTGVTIPEWTAVLMLSNVKSPALYMQAAFRAQNPYSYYDDGAFYRKENAYVFDFDPARTLSIYEQFANDLYSETSDGRGELDKRRENVRIALNFFPVVGEDEDGEMIELDAEKVLSIPRKIRCREVVKRGFMSDFLFQNVANVFRAPGAVLEILQKFTPVQEPKKVVEIEPDAAERLQLDENGEVAPSEEWVIGTATNLFGDKIIVEVKEAAEKITDALEKSLSEEERKDDDVEKDIIATFKNGLVDTAMEKSEKVYGERLRESDKKKLRGALTKKAERAAVLEGAKLKIKERTIENKREKALETASTASERDEINEKYEEEKREAVQESLKSIKERAESFLTESINETVRTVETGEREREKAEVETRVKDHLRGFSRTIPSFLMAYGDDKTTLENFDQIIPDEVFKEVTSITLEQFRFLRDGGEYDDEASGETKRFNGNLFDPVVFNDSVKHFLSLKRELADYFDPDVKGDIFDYIPPQRTNQIFTPKKVVTMMVDMLEKEEPGCFDRDDKTFADLYMKSGLYIAEIVKRLYRSEGMKRLHPDENERLRHIFAKQVYGLAPTRIIYLIATNYIFGFDVDCDVDRSHFQELDALKYAKEGTLAKKIDELFG